MATSWATINLGWPKRSPIRLSFTETLGKETLRVSLLSRFITSRNLIQMTFNRIAAICCCLLPLLIGCADSQGELKGSVSYKGTPLNSGSILFQCEAGPVESVEIQGDGTYVIAGLPKGPAKISVQVSKPPQPGPDGVITNEPGTYEPNPVLIPQKFGNVETSGLSVEVEGAQQTFDIALPE